MEASVFLRDSFVSGITAFVPMLQNCSPLTDIQCTLQQYGEIRGSYQYFGHLTQRVDSLEKTLMLGEIGGRRRRG